MADYLYKGKYLIAIYDGDELVDVGFNRRELKTQASRRLDAVEQALAHAITRNGDRDEIHSKYFFVDCYKVHDDIFKEEDEAFIEFIKQELDFRTCEEKAKELGVSLRQYFRLLKGGDKGDRRNNGPKRRGRPRKYPREQDTSYSR